MRFQDSGGVQILPPPSVQFKLYQGEVLQYKPGASDHQNRTRHGFESTHSENPQAPTQSERGSQPYPGDFFSVIAVMKG